MALLCSYVGARSCTGGPQPGARALMSWFLGAYAALGGLNSGIYSCRDISGSGVLSLHAEGRADDLGVRPLSAQWGWTLARALVAHSRELGIQLIIWDGHIWSASRCDEGWRPYHGASNHADHLHVELSWDAARDLTVADIQAEIGGGAATTTGGDPMIGLRKGDTGEAVKGLQASLHRAGFAEETGAVDGEYGPKVSAGLLACRKSQGSGATSGDTVTGWAYAQIMSALAEQQAGTGARGPRGLEGPAGPAGPPGGPGPAGPPGELAGTLTVTGGQLQVETADG